jgi:hypothetical protein
MTITYFPPAYASVHDDLIFTVTDAHTADPVTYPNYKFIADVYVNGVQVARLKKVPNPVTLVGVFDVSPVVRNYLQAVFAPTLALQSFQLPRGQFYLDLQVRFGEEYLFTSYYNIAASTTQKVYNNYNRQLFGTDSSLTGKANNVISNMPVASVFLNQDYSFISYFPTSTSSVTIQITPDNGSLFSTSITPSTAYFGQVLNVTPNAINLLSANKINAGTSYYIVNVGGESFRYNIICEPQYDIYELHWLNQYGGYDTKLFTKVSRTNASVQRSSFGVLPYTVDSGGGVSYYTGQVYNETIHNYANQFTERLTLNSNFLTDAEYEWLYDLLVSTQVYIYQNGYFKSVTITDNNYELKKRVNDNLTNLTITVEQGKTFNAQFR